MAGLPLTGYQKLLAQVAQRYPVVCAQGVRAADGSWLDEKQIAEDDLLNLYRTAVYAHINEPERLENFWAYAAGSAGRAKAARKNRKGVRFLSRTPF